MATLYSYSRLSTFNDCKRCYYYDYVLGHRGGESIYTYMGTAVHDIVEAMDAGTMDADTALEQFNCAIEEADMLGLQWVSEKSKQGYIDCISHYIMNHNNAKYNKAEHIEDVFAVTIADTVLYGFIDRWDDYGDTIEITDYKTSSKFSGKDLEHKKIQLYLYAEALQRYFPCKRIIIQYNMLKYARVGESLKLRTDLNIKDKYFDGIVWFEYDESCSKKLHDFVSKTIQDLGQLDEQNIFDWPRGRNPEQDFFCKSLCSHYEECREG